MQILGKSSYAVEKQITAMILFWLVEVEYSHHPVTDAHDAVYSGEGTVLWKLLQWRWLADKNLE
jgi:hypothetical protein